VFASAAAIVLVPLSIEIVGWIVGADVHMPASRVLQPVLVTVIAPLVLGVVFRRMFPAAAERIARPVTLFAYGLLAVSAIPVVITSGMAFWAYLGNGVVLCLVLFTAIGLVVGHLLGGPEPGDRAVLALATGTRHPGVAIAIATLNYPDQKAALTVMLWHLVIGAIVAIPYVRWQRARLAAMAGHAHGSQGGGDA
jgi:BASS family bile acid:Na+ symporter